MLTALFFLVAQTDPASLPADLDSGEALELLIKSLGGMKGAGALGIAYVITQGLMLFFRTKLADFTGKWKLLIVAGLSVVVGVMALKMSGLGWLASLVHGSTLAAASVFGNQLFKQFRKET